MNENETIKENAYYEFQSWQIGTDFQRIHLMDSPTQRYTSHTDII